MDSNTEQNRIFWFATVVDNEDPLMLNRVRVKFDTLNNESILNSVTGDTKTEDGKDLLPQFKWTEIDPFVLMPLIPIFVKTTPKKYETVNVFWPNKDFKYVEQYYVQGIFSSPLTMFRENFNAQRMFASRNRIEDPKLLKNPVNYEYYESETKGVFIEPDDVGLVGRGTCDLVIKENDVLLRSGKSKTLPDTPNRKITSNPKRSFVQLSSFSIREENLPDSESLVLKKNTKYVKYLFEYNIINPENTFNLFSYSLYLYSLPENPNYTTDKINLDTNIPNIHKSLLYSATFYNESMDEMTQKIITFIGQLNDGKLNLSPNPIRKLENQFPLFYRPAPETYKKSESPTTGSEFINISTALNKIDYKTQKNGFGLLWSKNVQGVQYAPKFIKQKRKKIKTDSPITYGIMAADKLLFLSHESRIPSKKLIVLDETTNYGLTQKYITDNVIEHTNSFVRGEELVKFLNLVVKFLQSHTHAFPGLPPVPISHDGTNVGDILQQLSNASETILNQNIRIN